ncbi:MAG TPA: alpha/beta hydrolase [Pseudonocardiaceae bacterium]|jgi:pimeloyl-ACP methyl ester carboxylesterase
MSKVWKVAGWVTGGVLGTAATAAAVATAAHHRRIANERALAAQLVDAVPAWRPPDREYTVTADDGVPLSVEEVDPIDGGAPQLTVVLVHGYTLDRRCWLYQRQGLAASTDPRVRLVLYDHRSHGRSGRSPRAACTIEQLGRDLDAVIRAAAPEGRVVLMGHSLGGMTIMALAEHNPEIFAERISGVAFLNTSAGDIGRSGLPRPVLSRRNPVMLMAARVARWQPELVERTRDVGGQVIWSLTRKLAFGDEKVNPAVVELMNTMMRGTSLEVMTDFLATFGAHNRYAALAGLQYVRALVLGAESDMLVQFEHSEAIAALLPDAELVRVPKSGHVTMLEQPELVNGHLLELVRRCEASGRPRSQPA